MDCNINKKFQHFSKFIILILSKVACFTEDDWSELCDSLSTATSKNEKILYRTLKEDFLPEIPNLFAEKERQQRYCKLDFSNIGDTRFLI